MFSVTNSQNKVSTLLSMHHLSITSLDVLNKCQQFFKVTSTLMNDSTSLLFKDFFADKQLEVIRKQQVIHDDLLSNGYIKLTKEAVLELIHSLVERVKHYQATTSTVYAKSSYDFAVISEDGERKTYYLAAHLKSKIRLMKNPYSHTTKKEAIQDLTGAYFQASQEMSFGEYTNTATSKAISI